MTKPTTATARPFNYKESAELAAACNNAAIDLARRYSLNEIDACNFLLEGVQIAEKHHRKAIDHHDELVHHLGMAVRRGLTPLETQDAKAFLEQLEKE